MTESPAEQVARLAAETEGARECWYCSKCGALYVDFAGCDHPAENICGPFVALAKDPEPKPAPPSSRETLAANVLRLRKDYGWSRKKLGEQVFPDRCGPADCIGFIEENSLDIYDDPFAELDALAKALDTTPAALLTPQEADA